MGFVLIIRPLNAVIAAATVVLAAFLAGERYPFPLPVVLAAAAAFLSASAGNVVNDVFDKRIDSINRPSRPIPSGRVSVQAARAYYYVLLALSQLAVLPLGVRKFAFVFFCNFLLFLYSYKQKNIPFYGHYTVAFLTAMPFLLGAWVAGNVRAAFIPALFALGVNFMREVVKAMEDVPGDSAYRVRTAATQWQHGRLRLLLAVTAALLFLLTIAVYAGRYYSVLFTAGMAVLVLPLITAAVKYSWQPLPDSLRTASRCLKAALLAGGMSLLAAAL